EVNIFSELHVILQGLMLIFQPLADGKATECHDPDQSSARRFHVVVGDVPSSAEVNSRHQEQDGNRGVELHEDGNATGNRRYAQKGLVEITHDDACIGEKSIEIAARDITKIF